MVKYRAFLCCLIKVEQSTTYQVVHIKPAVLMSYELGGAIWLKTSQSEKIDNPSQLCWVFDGHFRCSLTRLASKSSPESLFGRFLPSQSGSVEQQRHMVENISAKNTARVVDDQVCPQVDSPEESQSALHRLGDTLSAIKSHECIAAPRVGLQS